MSCPIYIFSAGLLQLRTSFVVEVEVSFGGHLHVKGLAALGMSYDPLPYPDDLTYREPVIGRGPRLVLHSTRAAEVLSLNVVLWLVSRKPSRRHRHSVTALKPPRHHTNETTARPRDSHDSKSE